MTRRFIIALFAACWLLVACAQPDPDNSIPAPDIIAATATPTTDSTATVTMQLTSVPATATTPQPEPTPNLGNLLVPFSAGENAYTLEFPDTWLTGEEPFQLFTSTEAYLDGIDSGESGALVAALPLQQLYAGDDLVTALDDVVERFPIADGLIMATEAALQPINGQEAATVTLAGAGSDGASYTAVYTLIRTEAQTLALISTAPTAVFDVYADTLDAIVNSVVLTAPPLDLAAVVPFTTVLSSDGGLQLSYPLDWTVTEQPAADGAYSLILASQEAVGDAVVTVSVIPAAEFARLALDAEASATAQLSAAAAFAGLELPVDLTALETTTIDGRTAVTLPLERADRDDERFTLLSVIVGTEQAVIVVGETVLERGSQAGQLLRQIAASVRFGPSLAAGATDYRDENLDFTFHYPVAWALNDADPTSLVLASSAQALATSDFGNGGVVFVFSQQFSELRPAEEIVMLFTSQFASLFSETETLVELRPFSQNGNDAATLVQAGLLDGDPLLLTYTAVVEENVSVLALALTPAGRVGDFYPEQEAILRSLAINRDE